MSASKTDQVPAHPRLVDERRLGLIVYHYVRELVPGRFAGLKGLSPDALRRQIQWLAERFEFATVESAVAFLQGRYRPSRDLMLVTLDDGLKEHYRDVTPIFVHHGIQGVFAVTTGCLDGAMATVHKNHCLLSALDFSDYRAGVLESVEQIAPDKLNRSHDNAAATLYRWDTLDVAAIKYLVNFVLTDAERDLVLTGLFRRYFGDEGELARSWYMSWDEAREMQGLGMVIAGHGVTHAPLATLDASRQQSEVEQCAARLKERLKPQPFWPFAYPYGSHSAQTAQAVRANGFNCAFTVEIGWNRAAQDPFALQRFDTNDVGSAQFTNGLAS